MCCRWDEPERCFEVSSWAFLAQTGKQGTLSTLVVKWLALTNHKTATPQITLCLITHYSLNGIVNSKSG